MKSDKLTEKEKIQKNNDDLKRNHLDNKMLHQSQKLNMIVSEKKMNVEHSACIDNKNDSTKTSNEFTIGETSFPVAFENDLTSQELKQILINDMNHIFSHFKNYRIVDRKTNIHIEGKHLQSTKALFCYGKGKYWPDEYNNFGALILKNNTYHLVIPQILTEAYERSMALKQKHQLQYKALDDFISKVNTLSKMNSNEIELDKLFDFNNAKSKKFYLNHPDHLLSQLSKYRIRKPALLDYHIKSGENKQLVAVTYFLDNNEIPIFETALIFKNNMWKIMLPDYGT
jgi:hypothetical protein